MTPIEGQYSIPFIFKLTQYLSIFGITPWYNFEQHKLIRPIMLKYYSSFILVVLVSSTVGLIWLRYNLIFNREFSVYIAIDFFLDVESLAIVSLPIISTTFWNMRTWINLYNNYNEIDASTKSVSSTANSAYMLKYGVTIFVLGNIYLFSLHHINDLVLKNKSDFSLYYISSFVLTYYEFLIAFTIISVSALIESKYVCINQLLISRESDVDFVKTAKKIRMLWLKLDDIVQDFNKLFGWSLLLMFFDFFLDILSALICATFAADNNDYNVEGGAIIINTCYLVQSAVS